VQLCSDWVDDWLAATFVYRVKTDKEKVWSNILEKIQPTGKRF